MYISCMTLYIQPTDKEEHVSIRKELSLSKSSSYGGIVHPFIVYFTSMWPILFMETEDVKKQIISTDLKILFNRKEK
jgi:hypothetical protein